MVTYVVYRVGSNTANQPIQDRRAVGFLDSPAPLSYRHRQWILEQWQEQHPTTTVYANQHLTLVPRSRVSVADWEQAELELDYEQNMNAYWAECETEMPRAGGHIP